MKAKTNVKAGGRYRNHNETLLRVPARKITAK